jgi:hypothetical protein
MATAELPAATISEEQEHGLDERYPRRIRTLA